MIENQWYDRGVTDKTLSMLYKWVEYKISSHIKSSYLPHEATRYVFKLGYNKNGVAIYSVTVLSGLEYSRSTAPKEFRALDEFSFVFHELEDKMKLVIMSFIDPFDEIGDRTNWIDFLRSHNIKNCDGSLSDALVNLQLLLERRGLVKSMEGNLRGWNDIAGFMKCSVPTAMKLVRELKLPVSRVGGEVWAMKDKLREALMLYMDSHPYHARSIRKG